MTVAASFAGIDLSGICYFFCGYILTKLGYNSVERKYSFVTAFALMCGSCVVRLVGKRMLDGFWLYDQLIVPVCHLSLAMGILFGIRWIRSKSPDRFDTVMSAPIVCWLDAISIYVYCFHGPFIAGELSVFRYHLPNALLIILVYLASFCAATIIYIPFETLGKRLRYGIDQKFTY